MAFSRRKLLTTSAFFGGAVAIVAYTRQAGEPPTEQWLRERIWDNLIAYAVWDGVPRAAILGQDRLVYDRIVPGDWIWPNWPPAPQWQLAGLGYSITVSDDPASIGFAPCPGFGGEHCGLPFEYFGQLNDPAIVAMEVRLGDEWQRFDVAAPGFAIRLDRPMLAPDGYRWLDVQDRIVWERDSPSLTRPGMRGIGAKRERQRATPAPETDRPS